MNRSQKEALISDIKDMFVQSEAAFLVKYQGLTVPQLEELRTKLREQNARLKVAKARLMKLATDEDAKEFAESFKDQVGLVFAMKEAPSAAKSLVDFSKENEALEIISGYFESRMLSKGDVSTLASIPPREVLLAQLLGGLKSPITGLACALNMTVLKLCYALQEVSKKKDGGA